VEGRAALLGQPLQQRRQRDRQLGRPGAKRGQHDAARARQPPDQACQRGEAVVVGGVQVIQRQHAQAAAAPRPQQAGHPLGDQGRQLARQRRAARVELPQRLQRAGETVHPARRRIRLGADGVGEHRIGGSTVQVVGPAGQHRPPSAGRPRPHRPQQRGLADARIAPEHGQLRAGLAGPGTLDHRTQRRQVGVAPDRWRGADLTRSRGRLGAGQGPHRGG
jgi:hypothetical protein